LVIGVFFITLHMTVEQGDSAENLKIGKNDPLLFPQRYFSDRYRSQMETEEE